MDIPHELHLQPSAGHWWDDEPDEPGAACVDWPPMFDLFARTRLPDDREVRTLAFTTPDPLVSDTRAWATIVRAQRALEPSSIALEAFPQSRRFEGTTQNVRFLSLDTSALSGEGAVDLRIDHAQINAVPDRFGRVLIDLGADGAAMTMGEPVPPVPVTRLGQAFENRPIFVYATGGGGDDGGWAAARARFDAEQLWYRGNGRIDVVSDDAFDPADPAWRGRNIVLYGNADTHGDWHALVGDDTNVTTNSIDIDGQRFEGDGLVLLAAQPNPIDANLVVGIVAPTGPAAAVASDSLPLFVSGVHYPRATVLCRENDAWTLVRALR